MQQCIARDRIARKEQQWTARHCAIEPVAVHDLAPGQEQGDRGRPVGQRAADAVGGKRNAEPGYRGSSARRPERCIGRRAFLAELASSSEIEQRHRRAGEERRRGISSCASSSDTPNTARVLQPKTLPAARGFPSRHPFRGVAAIRTPRTAQSNVGDARPVFEAQTNHPSAAVRH